MLEASDTPALQTSPSDDSVLMLRELIERMQAEIKFSHTRIEALNFEIARLKRWRFGSSAESLDGSTQAVLHQRHRQQQRADHRNMMVQAIGLSSLSSWPVGRDAELRVRRTAGL